jgi:hypothetical protein
VVHAPVKEELPVVTSELKIPIRRQHKRRQRS